MTVYFCISISLSLPQLLRLPLSVLRPFPALIPPSLCASLPVPPCPSSCVPISLFSHPRRSISARLLRLLLSTPPPRPSVFPVALRPFLYPSFCPPPTRSIASPSPLSLSLSLLVSLFPRCLSLSLCPSICLSVLSVSSGSGPPPPQPSPAANEQRSL